METDFLDSNVAKEVLTILLYSDEKIGNSIPREIYSNLTELAADSTLDIKFDKDKNLIEQNISSDALDMFSLLYYLYATDADEQKEILSSWIMNDENA